MTSFVTGCAGFVGSHLAETLLRSGERVLGVDCSTNSYDASLKQRNLDVLGAYDRFELVRGDLATLDLTPFVAKAETIYHLAGEPGVRQSWGQRFSQYTHNNVLATHALLRAAVQAPLLRAFVYASSSSIYGEAETLPTPETAHPRPVSPYGITKLAAEHLCHAYYANFGVPTVSLRFFTVYGPRQRPDMAFNIFCAAALANEPIVIFGDGIQSRDFTYVADIVDGLVAAAACEAARDEVFNLGGGSQTSINEALAIIADAAGRKLEIVHQDSQAGDVRHTSADTTKAQSTFEFAPKTSVASGLAAEFAWLQGLG
jgi:nucleoside-diphosphate-sugar epimerase